MERLLLRHHTTQFTNVMALKIILKVDDLQNYLVKKEYEAEQEHGTIINKQKVAREIYACVLLYF